VSPNTFSGIANAWKSAGHSIVMAARARPAPTHLRFFCRFVANIRFAANRAFSLKAL